MVGVDGDCRLVGDGAGGAPECVCGGHGDDCGSTRDDADSRAECVCLCGAASHRVSDPPGNLFRAANAVALLAADGGNLCAGDLWVLFAGTNALSAPVEPHGTAFHGPASAHVRVAAEPLSI